MLKDLIIIGTGGFSKEVAWLIERINAKNPTWNLIGFSDKADSCTNSTFLGYPIIPENDVQNLYPDAWYVCAIGAAALRKKIASKFEGRNFATLIDPSVLMSNRVTLGEGTIICAGSIITVDISIGKHTIVNLDCTIGHDVAIHDFVTLYPSVNVSGFTEIGECSEVGTGSQIIQGKVIGSDSIVGAGSVVVKDIPSKCTAVGAPAKPIKFLE